jgi:hypothetical protein
MKTVREDSGPVHLPTSASRFEAPNAIVGDLVGGETLFQVLSVHRHAISNSPTRQIVIEPTHVIAVIRNPVLNAKSLGDEATALRVEAEGNRIGHVRLGGEQFDCAAVRESDARHRLPRLVGSSGDLRLEPVYGLLAVSKPASACREKEAPKHTN